MADCPFCKRIAAGEYDKRGAHAVTFEPLGPVTPGHRLVVPVAHLVDALDSPVMTGLVMEFAAEVALDYGLAPCNFITSAGPEATQSVYHLRWHIVPRRAGDGLLLPWGGQHAKYRRSGDG